MFAFVIPYKGSICTYVNEFTSVIYEGHLVDCNIHLMNEIQSLSSKNRFYYLLYRLLITFLC